MVTLPLPHETYTERLAKQRREQIALNQTADRLSYGRLAAFGVGGLLIAGVMFQNMSIWWLSLPIAVFTGLVIRHDRVLLACDKVSQVVAWYEHGLARLEDRWSGLGEPGNRFANPDHLYAQDLDLFGTGSLFQLLNTAQTKMGEATLATWLLGPAPVDEVKCRQEAVRDLQLRILLREQLAAAGTEISTNVAPSTLLAWANGSPVLTSAWLRFVGLGLSLFLVGLVAAWSVGMVPGTPVLVGLLAGLLFQRRFNRQTTEIMHAVVAPACELIVLGRVAQILRQHDYGATRLTTLRKALQTADGEIIQVVQRLQRVVEMHDWQHNILFRPVAAFLFWELQCAFVVERWRARYGQAVAGWLDEAGTFEALVALSTYNYEHPRDPFPELVDNNGTARFEADGLTHPLIPTTEGIANDVHLDSTTRVLIVSGSNMSGKTTLLRSVGVGAVMALAGAPVRAQRLCLSSVHIGATLRIEDSLQAGRSRFYAEVLRLGHVLETTRRGPTLYLLDELFHGTNSHDRADGARALLSSLLSLGAVGLITTHDLALVKIAEHLIPSARNVHFDDTLVGEEMQFDYRLKPGPVTRSNALAIMRAVGLDVPNTVE